MVDAMRVHLYQVTNGQNTPAIETVFAAVQATPMAQRLRELGNSEIRLESILAPGGNANPTAYWFLDFTRLRFEHGPGKASRTAPVQGFTLGENEGFGEETAALYDPGRGYLLVQYNHFGVRASSIRDYLSFFIAGQIRDYEFRAKFDDASEAKLAQKQILTKIHFKIAPTNMTDAQRAANVGLGQALELNDSVRGQSVEVVISAGQSKNAMLSSKAAMKIINGLRSLIGSDQDVVDKFEVSGRTAIGERAEAIDMLSPKVEQTIDGIIMGPDRRYTQHSRWNALLRARNGWNNLI